MMKQIEPVESAWYPVRCCCVPQKVFGFLRLRVQHPYPGTVHHVKTRDRFGVEHILKMKPMYDNLQSRHVDLESLVSPEIFARLPHPSMEHAIYSEDRPREFWRVFEDYFEVSGGEP